MTLGIMQPYFFPYLGYFSLMKHTDRWVFFDTPQYIRKGWVNRNRVLKKNEGWKYIRIGVEKHSQNTAINEIHIKKPETATSEVIKHLDYYKEINAPYYRNVIEFLKSCEETFSGEMLSEFLIHTLKMTCNYLGIELHSEVFSESAYRAETTRRAEKPGDWALLISEALQAKSYINPPGGREIFDLEKFSEKEIELLFLKNKLLAYSQQTEKFSTNRHFEAGLSIIDAMMFNSPEEVSLLIDATEYV